MFDFPNVNKYTCKQIERKEVETMTINKDNAAIELFRKALENEGKSPHTIKNYVSDLKHLINNIPPQQGDAPFNPPQKAIETYTSHFEKSGLSKPTLNRRLNALRTYFRIMNEAGHITDNPTTNIRQLTVARQNTTKWLERHQVKQIFEAIDKRTNVPEAYAPKARAIISILVNCGLRLQELCDIKMTDINWESGVMKVVGKGDKFRFVPFNLATKKSIQHWLKFRSMDTEFLFHTERSPQMTTRSVQHMLKVLQSDLNFSFEPHHLRHTALKRIADTTGRIETVAAIAGHENVETSRRYIEPSIKEISEAMQQTEYDF